LFNGKNLTGWQLLGGDRADWTGAERQVVPLATTK